MYDTKGISVRGDGVRGVSGSSQMRGRLRKTAPAAPEVEAATVTRAAAASTVHRSAL